MKANSIIDAKKEAKSNLKQYLEKKDSSLKKALLLQQNIV